MAWTVHRTDSAVTLELGLLIADWDALLEEI